MHAEELRKLELPGVSHFVERSGGLVALEVNTPLANAVIYLLGAHVAEWTPSGQPPVLFMSKQSHFIPGKPIRGGVPVCFPWFAARTGHPDSPAHGVVRQAEWQIESLTQEPDRTVVATLVIQDNEATLALWPHRFIARHRVRIGTTLEMMLEVENRGSDAFTFEEALHTYFSVSAIQSVEVLGLQGAEYIDKVEGFARKTQQDEALRFTGETDRVFPNTTATCVLSDPGLQREIVVEKSNSQTTVVWNPWIKKAAAMSDFADEEWPFMACIETANAGQNALSLPPGATHRMTAKISIR